MDYRSIFMNATYSKEEQKQTFTEMLDEAKSLVQSDKVDEKDVANNLTNLFILLRVLVIKYGIRFEDIIKMSDEKIDRLTEGRKIFDE